MTLKSKIVSIQEALSWSYTLFLVMSLIFLYGSIIDSIRIKMHTYYFHKISTDPLDASNIKNKQTNKQTKQNLLNKPEVKRNKLDYPVSQSWQGPPYNMQWTWIKHIVNLEI